MAARRCVWKPRRVDRSQLHSLRTSYSRASASAWPASLPVRECRCAGDGAAFPGVSPPLQPSRPISALQWGRCPATPGHATPGPGRTGPGLLPQSHLTQSVAVTPLAACRPPPAPPARRGVGWGGAGDKARRVTKDKGCSPYCTAAPPSRAQPVRPIGVRRAAQRRQQPRSDVDLA